MNVQNAAIKILKDAGKPLHAKEIAKRIIEAGLWSSDGKTPEATVSARLYSDIKKHGDQSTFVKVAPQTFFLLAESMERCWQKFFWLGIDQPKLSIKRMQKRWGSFLDKGTVTLNTDLIRAPKECIDYVVTHELCHLKYHDHSPEFYKLLDAVIPGWEKIKHKLELSMV